LKQSGRQEGGDDSVAKISKNTERQPTCTAATMSAAMVKNPAEADTVMATGGVGRTGHGPILPLTTNMTASYLTSGGNSCLDEQIERLKRCEYLREGEVKALCLRAREILVDESNVQRVDAPVTVRTSAMMVFKGWS
jgi:hypothetical protein